jgi:hypothetical protein
MLKIVDLAIAEFSCDLSTWAFTQVSGGTTQVAVTLGSGAAVIQNNGGNMAVGLIPGQIPQVSVTNPDGTVITVLPGY